LKEICAEIADVLKHKNVERHQRLEWFQLLPLVNVDINWPNSMGWITRIRVDGHILATLAKSQSAGT